MEKSENELIAEFMGTECGYPKCGCGQFWECGGDPLRMKSNSNSPLAYIKEPPKQKSIYQAADDWSKKESVSITVDQLREAGVIPPKQEEESQEDHREWDTALTDAIVETDGKIQPYFKILSFLSEKYRLTRK
jgi:hypothetical protein